MISATVPTQTTMTERDTNPYAPPKPIEAHQSIDAHKRSASPRANALPRLGLGALLWWCYFAVCCWMLAVDITHIVALVHFHSVSALMSPFGLVTLIYALGLVGLLCYIRKIPLLNSFFWGLVFVAQLGRALYLLAMTVTGLARLGTIYWSWRGAMFIALPLVLLPESFALWRYSSASSPIWKKPRIQWKRLAQRLWDAIQALRRS